MDTHEERAEGFLVKDSFEGVACPFVFRDFDVAVGKGTLRSQGGVW